MPPGIHAGGLRYHGMAPLVSHLLDLGLIEAIAVQQLDAFAAGVQFAQAEGIIPAPEANHAVAGAIREALRSCHPFPLNLPAALRHKPCGPAAEDYTA